MTSDRRAARSLREGGGAPRSCFRPGAAEAYVRMTFMISQRSLEYGWGLFLESDAVGAVSRESDVLSAHRSLGQLFAAWRQRVRQRWTVFSNPHPNSIRDSSQ